MIAQQDELIRKLEEVERKVAKDNAEMKAGIAKLKEEARKLKRSRRDVQGFVYGWWSAHIIYDHELPVETFEDYGMDDFGGGFDSGMDFGGFDDW